MAAFDLDSKHGARQGLGDLAFDLDLVLLLGQIPFVSNAQKMRTKYRLVRTNYGSKLASSLPVRIFGPTSVTATVCSKWAESDLSAVEIDHSSSWR